MTSKGTSKENDKTEVCLENKTFKSLSDLKRNGSDDDLINFLQIYDKKIVKTERKLTLGNIQAISLGILTLGGLGGLVAAPFLLNGFKEILAFVSASVAISSGIGMVLNFKKYLKVENDLEDMQDAYDDVVDELIDRERLLTLKKEAKEIFTDI